MGTLKVVPSEQRFATNNQTRPTAGNNNSGSLIRLGKQTTEIDINFAGGNSQSIDIVQGVIQMEK